MSEQAIEIDALTVTARRPQPTSGRTGEQTTDLSQDLLNRLPLPDLDPNTIALLATGVIATELDSLSGKAGFSVAGMSDLLNQVLLDGMVLGESGLQVPQEGIRRTSVTTSTFDAARGGFAGGQVSMTSARGNNRVNGSLSYSLDNDALQLGSATTVNAFSRQNLGASIGGPIVANKLFTNLSFGLQRNVNHRFAIAANDATAATRAGVAMDSVTRFVNALSNYGIPVSARGEYDHLRDNLSLQWRTDWNMLQRETQSHTLSLRINGSKSGEDSTRINALDLAQHGGEVEGDNWAGALTVNSRLGTNWTNAVTASYNESWNNSLPYVEIPEGRVRVTSEFDDASRGTQTLVFGGNRNMPSDRYNRGLQLSNDLSFLKPVGSQLHRFKIGGMLRQQRNISQTLDNVFGSFLFNSIDDLERNAPVRFERTLADETERVGSMTAGLYLGDTWRVSEPFELTVGLRWDYTRMDQTPAYNPAIASTFGRRTDVEPIAMTFSPRIGFNYRLAAADGMRSARTLSGGIGVFAGQTPSNIFAAAARQTGLADAEQQLVCVGAATPIPDWDLYLSNQDAIPTACADGSAGGSSSSRLPTISLINPDQRMPASLRAELGYRTRLPLNLNANLRYSYSRGYGLWGYYDINLDEAGAAMLGAENRPFFGDLNAIVPATGQTTLSGSRRFGDFGNVSDIRADRSSSTHQLTTQVSGLLPKAITLSANYTLSFAEDEGTGNARFAPTAGSPNDVEWAPSSQDRRHTLNLTIAKAITDKFEITAIARMASGAPFTPMVGGDINGDGLFNDRAFVFDATSSSDPAIAQSMSRLLSVVPDRIADCLTSQAGTIAGRNSCRNGWTRSLDMRASIRPVLPQLERRLTLSVDASNILRGSERVDTRLLDVRGFNAATSSFIYAVNEDFGQNRRGSSSIRDPFALRITARLAVGGQNFQNNRGFGGPPMAMGPEMAERFRERMEGGGRRPGGDGGPGGPGGGFNAVGLLDRMLANPIPVLLELKDTLQLSAEQVAKIQLISDTLGEKLTAKRVELGKKLETQQGGAQQGRMFAELQPAIEGVRKDVAAALKQVEAVMTKEQWERVPERIRNPFQRGQRQMRRPE
jgi:hypothetical protein